MNSKRGGVGVFTVTFVATIIIMLILIGFVLLSSTVKIVSKENVGLVMHNEDMIGIDDGIGYMENYVKLVEAKSKVGRYLTLGQALLEVGYEK